MYHSYSFVGKDPVIERLRQMIHEKGWDYAEVASRSGVNVSTLYTWFYGNVRLPRFATVAAVARALGYEITFASETMTMDLRPVPVVHDAPAWRSRFAMH